MVRWIAVAACLFSTTANAASTARHYAVESSSFATARVPFFGVTNRSAHFPRVTGSIAIDPANTSKMAIDVTLDASALTADDSLTRDRLKGSAFFDVEHTPNVHFVGGHMRLTDPTHASVEGMLTARGISQPVTLDVTFSEPVNRSTGVPALHLTGHTTIDRTRFGMTSYRLIVGRKVNVDLDITLRQQG